MDLTKKAIDAALNRDWKQAISVNNDILKHNTKDLEALNRLGRAYMETGLKTKASEIYAKVLKLDKYNSIAQKNLQLLKTMKVHRGQNHSIPISAPIFLEEPGITKTAGLTRQGDQKVISRMHAGDMVKLAAREHCVAVTSIDNEYLGRLPDDLALRMRSFLKAGNKYEAWIRSIDHQSSGPDKYSLKIFIREIYRSSKYKNTPSFPSTEKLTYAAFTPPNLIYDDRPIITTPEEDVPDDLRRDSGDDQELTPIPEPDDD